MHNSKETEGSLDAEKAMTLLVSFSVDVRALSKPLQWTASLSMNMRQRKKQFIWKTAPCRSELTSSNANNLTGSSQTQINFLLMTYKKLPALKHGLMKLTTLRSTQSCLTAPLRKIQGACSIKNSSSIYSFKNNGNLGTFP